MRLKLKRFYFKYCIIRICWQKIVVNQNVKIGELLFAMLFQ